MSTHGYLCLLHYIQCYPHTSILKATLPSLKGFSQLFDHITASTQLPIHTLVIKGNIITLLRMRDQTLATLCNVHAKVSMTNRGSSSQPLQPGNSINQIISQIIQRDRPAMDNQSADIFGKDQQLFTSPANNGNGSDNGQQQSTSGVISETGSNTTSQLDSKGEFEALQLLTQYIGPRKPNPVPTARHWGSSSNFVEQQMIRFKEVFLEKTDKLDRAWSHLDSLTRAVQKNRILNKLTINVKPLVIDKENPTFVRK